ncbi:MAG: LapA family protein [Negativicutes bacterium]|nr:LapA family protein [Negativicutes bacterium]
MYEIIYERSDNMAYLILMLVVSVAVALFAVQNAMMVDVSFMAWKFSTSLVVVIICSLLAGIIISLFWLLKMKTQNYLQFKKMREQIAELENKNSKLAEENKILMYTQKQRMEAQEYDKATIKEADACEKETKQTVV